MKLPKLKNIVLGVFHTEEFEHVKKSTNSLDFLDFEKIVEDFVTEYEYSIIVNVVELACKCAENIHFCLDYIKLPLNIDVFTCEELIMIIENKHIGKVQFWLNKRKVATGKVLAIIEKAEKLTFSNIDFETV